MHVRCLAVILAMAFLLRRWGISEQSLHPDEYFKIFMALRASSLADFFSQTRSEPFHLFLSPFLDFLTARFGTGASLSRLPNALIATASVGVLFRLGRRLGGPRLGLLAAAMLAASFLDLEWSRRVGFYPLVVLLTLLSVDASWSAAKTAHRRGWAPFVLVHAAFAYAHPYAFLVLGLEVLWILLCHRGKIQPVVASLALIAFLYSPWYLYSTDRLLEGGFFHCRDYYGWRPLEYLARTLVAWGGAPHALLFSLGAWRLSAARGWTPEWRFVAALPPAGLIALLFLDWTFDYFFDARQTLFILPFYLLIASRGIEEILGRLSRRAAALAALAALAAFSAAYSAEMASSRRSHDELLRKVSALSEAARLGLPLVFANANSAQVFLYHYDLGAFLQAVPPRLYDSFYQFRLPAGLRAGPDAVPILSVADSSLTLDEEKRRWDAELGTADRFTLANGFRLRMPRDEEKLAEFDRRFGLVADKLIK